VPYTWWPNRRRIRVAADPDAGVLWVVAARPSRQNNTRWRIDRDNPGLACGRRPWATHAAWVPGGADGRG